MRLTRLEIFGFKSFVERFVLTFDRPMIGVVGPNGCGKSNIVDALRWVLGETHAKQLRGSAFEDLIFNGSDSRRPLGMAEVSITIRPDRGWQQNIPARLRQLEGEEEIAEPTAEEIGTVEAVALRPAASLADIPGLFDAAEIQLTRRLYRSGESEYFINRVPCRLRDMTDLYRLIGLGARGLSIVQQGQISDIINKKPVDRRELLEEAAGISGFRTRVEAAQRKLERTAENMARLNDIATEVEKQLRFLRRQAKRAQNREELKARLEGAERGLFAARAARLIAGQRRDETNLAQLNEKLLLHDSALSSISADEEQHRAATEAVDMELADLRGRREELGVQIQRERSLQQGIQLAEAAAEGKLRSILGNLKRVDQRKEQIGIEVEQRRLKLTSLRGLLSEQEQKRQDAEAALLATQTTATDAGALDGLDGDSALISEIASLTTEAEAFQDVTLELNQLERSVSEHRHELHQLREQLQRKRVAHARVESELKSLTAQLEAMAEHVVKSTGRPQEGTDQSTVLLAALKVPPELQRPLAAVLGEKAHYLVSDQPLELLAQFAEQQRKRSGGESSRVGVLNRRSPSALATATLSAEELAAAPSAVRIIDRLEIDPAERPLIEALLSQVVVVETADEAVRLGRMPLGGRTIVTMQGEILSDLGWHTTTGKGADFAFTRRIDEKRGEGSALQSELEKLAATELELQALFTDQERAWQEKKLARDRLIQAQKQLSNLLQQQQLRERRRRESLLEAERREQIIVRAVAADVAKTRGTIEFDERRMEELKRELITLDAESGQLIAEQSSLEGELKALAQRLAAETPQNAATLLSLEQELAATLASIARLDQHRAAIRSQLAVAAQRLEEERRRSNRQKEEQNQLILAIERARIELSMQLEEIQRLYLDAQMPTDSEIAALLADEVESIEQRISREQREAGQLRGQIQREGDVDPSSIELCATEEQRYAELTRQYNDLKTAAATLESTIARLKEISRKRFLETFESVSRKYAELVPRLFGGGAGQMELLNPEDPLSSGVELTVRPPGKRLRNLDLLSGGEKALAAAAVLMAMFLHHPSPICVLDEVDAPLDDANLDRFLALINEISASTQFLMITHNKQSMSAVDRLIGITMQESGVSTALSVTLAEAEQEIERWAAAV